jgi:PIN domain nuclease of toxin-antitoxin system
VKILIDTGCWLWSLTDPERLNKEARNLLSNPSQSLFLSAASSWEIAIKAAMGKLRLPEPPEKYVPSRMAAFHLIGLPVEHAHALRVFALPAHHRDPFDRILIAQAQTEGLAILTADRAFAAYDVATIWAAK